MRTDKRSISAQEVQAVDLQPSAWRIPLLQIGGAVGASVVVAGIIVAFNGGILLPSLIIVAPLALLFLVARLELGIYALLASAMLLEQFQIFGIGMPLTAQVPVYLNLSTITGIGPLVMNPVELILATMIAAWALRAASSREWHLRPIPHLETAALFLAVLLFYTAYGLARGGDFKVALWEIRALYYLCGVFFLATQVVRTERQVRVCLWIIIIGVSIKGMQGCYRFFVELGGSIEGANAITSHEDALFMAVAFTFMGALFLLDDWRRAEFHVLAAAFPTTFLTFILTQRRVAYGIVVFNLLIVFALLPKARKVFALKCALPLVPVLVLYTGVFWNSSSTLAMPIQQVRSIFEEGENEDTSNIYRKIENYNVEQTIRQNPLGVGFGKKYLILIPLPEVDFPLWDYIPHNCVYWMWAKTGFFGFLVFWLFFGTYAVQAIIDYRNESNTFHQAVCLMVATFIIAQMVVAYYDLQITFYRNMIYLGTAMALPIALKNRDTHCEGDGENAR